MKDIGQCSPTVEAGHLAGLLPLFRELNGLKRIRVAGKNGSWAERMFTRAWARLIAEEDVGQVACEETASAVVATSLAGIDAEVLAAGGIPPTARQEILRRAFDATSHPLLPALAATLRATLTGHLTHPPTTTFPPCVPLLAAQPRAGATRPGLPRVMLHRG